ncbi:MAG TPA: DMT family transporter [Methylomirabilota bacterium]|jgi:drug/metabolite transporter (DMT)-like permease|nr:DMT family transporter [Methylomirabilota bacterium]
MPAAQLVLVVANLVYATAPTMTRLTLEHVSPSTLAFAELLIASVLLVPLALRRDAKAMAMSAADRWRIAGMGLIGFAVAFSLSNWGIRLSSASNAALLITLEPASLIVLSPLLLGEKLTRREASGAALALLGATVIVVNGVPGVTTELAPRWRGDVLLVLAAVAYASYTLLGRRVLSRHRALPVTAWSLLCGAAGMVPLVTLEHMSGQASTWTPAAVAGMLYLAVVVVALGFMGWNYAVERLEAPRVAIFLNIQPLAGALIGVWWLGEPLTVFTIAGGLLILTGLHVGSGFDFSTRGDSERPSTIVKKSEPDPG